MSEPKAKALVLDIGNVVLELSFETMLDAFGVLDRNASPILANPFDDWASYDAYERGQLSDNQFVDAVRKRLGKNLPREEFEKAWHSIFVGEVKGIYELLEGFQKSHPLYALTNTNPLHWGYVMRQYPVLSLFKQIFTSFELGMRKPEAKLFQTVSERIDVAPQSILFVDDHPKNIQGAHEQGFRTALCRNSSTHLQNTLNHHFG